MDMGIPHKGARETIAISADDVAEGRPRSKIQLGTIFLNLYSAGGRGRGRGHRGRGSNRGRRSNDAASTPTRPGGASLADFF